MISGVAIDIIERARAVPIEQIIAAHGIKLRGRIERVGPCPRCGGDDRFAINIRKQVWNCRGCKQGGDVIALMRFLDGAGFREACATLAGQDWGEATSNQPEREDAGTLALVNRIWSEAENPAGTIAEQYLRSRKLTLRLDLRMAVLRIHPECVWENSTAPCLIAAFRSIKDDSLTGIHRVRLDQPEHWPKAERKMLGRIAGSAIKLDPVADRLCVGEGLETTLAGRQCGFRPAWALGSATGIENLLPIEGVTELGIFGENDGGRNQKAAETCRENWKQARVLLITPTRGKDFNDYLLERANDLVS